jgi:hypothetical protein
MNQDRITIEYGGPSKSSLFRLELINIGSPAVVRGEDPFNVKVSNLYIRRNSLNILEGSYVGG